MYYNNIMFIFTALTVFLVDIIFFPSFKSVLCATLYEIAIFILCETCNFLSIVMLMNSISDVRSMFSTIFLCYTIAIMVFNTLRHIIFIYYTICEVRWSEVDKFNEIHNWLWNHRHFCSDEMQNCFDFIHSMIFREFWHQETSLYK